MQSKSKGNVSMDISSNAAGVRSAAQANRKPRALSRYAMLMVGSYALVLVLAALLRLALIDYYYPVLRNHDEFFRFLNTMLIRDDMPEIAVHWGVYDFNPNYNYEGFPPVQMWLHAPVQRLVEANIPFPFPPEYILWARFVSAGVSLLTTVFVAWMGWYVARPLGRVWAWMAGFAAMLAWAVSPIILHVGNLALIDPLLYPYIPLLGICTVYAIRQDAPLGVFLGLLLAIASIYTKYILVYALLLPAVATAVLIWRRGGTAGNVITRAWRGMVAFLPWLALMALVSAASMCWLVFVHDMFAMSNRETNVLYQNGLLNALSPYRNWVNSSSIIALTTGLVNYALVIVAGVWGHRYARRHNLPRFEAWIPIVLAPFLVVAFMMISSVVVNSDTSRMRYPIAPMVGLLAIWALCLAQGALALHHRWQANGRQRARLLTGGAVAIALLSFFVPHMWENANTALAYRERYIDQVVWEWTDATLPAPEGTIMAEGLPQDDWTKYVWDRTVSGYNGATPFAFAHVPDVPQDKTPRMFWEENGIAYFFVSELDLQQGDPALRGFTEQLALLKTFGVAPGADYPSYFYRLLPPQHTADATFGGHITLAGYDLSAERAAPGDALTLRPFWQAAQTPAQNYSMFVHLRPTDDPTAVVTQADGAPAAPARLTLTWDDPDELVVGAAVTLQVPAGVEPGDYELYVGLYNFETFERLTLDNGADGYSIPVTISPAAQ